MIQNLPKQYPIYRLQDFNFGNVEGKFDELLQDQSCVCLIDPVHDIINGRASIIVGERGAGKSAIFRLFNDKRIKYKSTDNNKQIIVSVDDELNYRAIKQHVSSVVKSKIDDNSLIYRVVWEVYLVHKILTSIKDFYHGKISDSLKSALQNYDELFGKKKKISLIDLIQSNKNRQPAPRGLAHFHYPPLPPLAIAPLPAIVIPRRAARTGRRRWE